MLMAKSIIIDWKQTLYDPSSNDLIIGAQELLDYLQNSGVDLYLVGKGDKDMYDEVIRLKVKTFFKEVFFVGTEKKQEHFKRYLNMDNPNLSLVIGDKLSSEIEIGNKLGATTIQVRQGKFANEEPENENQIPNFVVTNLFELLKLLQGL